MTHVQFCAVEMLIANAFEDVAVAEIAKVLRSEQCPLTSLDLGGEYPCTLVLVHRWLPSSVCCVRGA